MPRAPSEKQAEAEKLFRKGKKLTDIAKKLGVPEGTVRSWKNRGKWGVGASKKNNCNVANDNDDNATLQKRKRGAQKGNKNAVGGRGNPSPVYKVKHGAYRAVFLDALDDDEQGLIDMVPEDEELLLMEQIQLFSIRERRILLAIKHYREKKGDLAPSEQFRSERKRSFANDEDKELYKQRITEKVEKGERLPGDEYNLQTSTTNKHILIARLEQELSTVQSKKTKAIEALTKLRIERQKLEEERGGNDIVKAWAEQVMKARREANDE